MTLLSPTLPAFKSILISGSHPPSLPIHICSVHIANSPSTSAVVIAPSRDAFVHSLKTYNDTYLTECGGHGRVAKVLSEVELLYAPTPAHLVWILSNLSYSNGPPKHPKMALDKPLGLLVLYDLSAYFMDENKLSCHTLSSYLLLVSNALALINSQSNLENTPPKIVLIDEGLETLGLPILRPPPEEEAHLHFQPREEAVQPIVQKYFDWHGTVEEDVGSDVFVDTPAAHRSYRLKLVQNEMSTWLKELEDNTVQCTWSEGSSSVTVQHPNDPNIMDVTWPQTRE